MKGEASPNPLMAVPLRSRFQPVTVFCPGVFEFLSLPTSAFQCIVYLFLPYLISIERILSHNLFKKRESLSYHMKISSHFLPKLSFCS